MTLKHLHHDNKAKRIARQLDSIRDAIDEQNRIAAPCFSALDATGEAPLSEEEARIARALLDDEVGPLPALRPAMQSSAILRA